MSYQEYREKNATRKIDDLNTEVQQYFRDYTAFANSAVYDLQNAGYQNATSMLESRIQLAADLQKKADALLTSLGTSGDILSGEYSELLDLISSTRENVDSIMEALGEQANCYSQWDTEEAYKEALAAQKAYEDLLNFNLAAGQWEIERLEQELEEFDSLTRWEQNEEGKKREEWFRNKYGTVGDLKALISEKKAYLKRAEYLQEGQKLASVSGNEDFDTYKGYVSTALDGWRDKLTSQYGLGYGDLIYEYINGSENGMRWNIIQKAAMRGAGSIRNFMEKWSIYNYMEPEEIDIYNYYYAKEGKEAAEKYLDCIRETLNNRKAIKIYESMEDKVLRELAFGVTAGFDQFESGLKNLFNFKDDYIPQTAIQMASGMVREDLADDSIPLWYNFKTGEWEDQIFGHSLGQVGYDTITTASNMLPSIVTSMAVSAINPVAGTAVGSVLMGASAAGNAYQEMLNLGYDKGQARAYSTLVGASEAGLQYLLGGIGKVGGKLTNAAVNNILNGVDNALARAAIKFGGNILSEGIEEGLQEILTPWFKEMATHIGEDIDWSNVAYSSLLGTLTAFFMEGSDAITGKVNQQLQYSKAGADIKGVDGGLDALMNLANEVAGVSSEDVRNTLTSQIDKVNQNPTARQDRGRFSVLAVKDTEPSPVLNRHLPTGSLGNDRPLS